MDEEKGWWWKFSLSLIFATIIIFMLMWPECKKKSRKKIM